MLGFRFPFLNDFWNSHDIQINIEMIPRETSFASSSQLAIQFFMRVKSRTNHPYSLQTICRLSTVFTKLFVIIFKLNKFTLLIRISMHLSKYQLFLQLYARTRMYQYKMYFYNICCTCVNHFCFSLSFLLAQNSKLSTNVLRVFLSPT